MTFIFEGQPPQNKAFSSQNKDHLGSRYNSSYQFIHKAIYRGWAPCHSIYFTIG